MPDPGRHERPLEIHGRDGRLTLSLYRYDGLDLVSSKEVPGGIASRLVKAKDALVEMPRGISIMRQGGDLIGGIGRRRPARCGGRRGAA